MARLRPRGGQPGLGVALAVLLWPAGAAGQGSRVLTLTLEQALETARRFSPVYRQVLNDEGPAEYAVRSAYSKLLLPQATLVGSASYVAEGEPRFGQITFGRQPAFRLSNYQIGLEYRLSGETLLRPGQAKAERRSVAERVRAAEILLRAEVTRAYLEVLRLRDQAAQARLERDRAEQHLQFARARESVGAGTALETRQAEVALGQAEVALLRAENGARVAVLRFAQTLGIEPPDSLALTTAFDVFEPRWTRDEMLAIGVRENPDLNSLRAAESAARTGLRIARSSYLPSLSLSANWSGFTREATSISSFVEQAQTNLIANFQLCRYLNARAPEENTLPPLDCSIFDPTPSRLDSIADAIAAQNDQFPFDFQTQPRTLTLAIAMPVSTPLQILRPIPVLGGLGRWVDPDLSLAVEQAAAARGDAAERLRARELQLRADITEAVYNLETAYRTAELQRANRERAREELRLAQERFRLGAGTFLELLDSQALASQAEVQYIEAVYAFHSALAALEAAIGRPLARERPEAR